MEKALSVNSLSMTFDSGLFEKKKTVLSGVTFEVNKGDSCGFVGGNGAGKTTTLKAVLGFLRPQVGEILFWGSPLSNLVKQKIGYLPERPYFYDFMTATEFLRLHWDLGDPKNPGDFLVRRDEVLHQVALSDVKDRALRSFSKGMLQRIGLAQAILHRPEFLILDEPMSGLDPDGRLLVKDLIQEQRKLGTTVFFSSHLLHDMEELCNRIVVIHDGKIIYQGGLAGFQLQDPSLEQAFRRLQLGRHS